MNDLNKYKLLSYATGYSLICTRLISNTNRTHSIQKRSYLSYYSYRAALKGEGLVVSLSSSVWAHEQMEVISAHEKYAYMRWRKIQINKTFIVLNM